MFNVLNTSSQRSYCPWALTPDPSSVLPSSARHTLSCLVPTVNPQPGLPISSAHPTMHVHVEGLSWRWRFLHGGRGRLKEIKEESFTAVIAPLQLAHHQVIIICEKYIHIKNPLLQTCLPHWLFNEGQGEKWDWESTKFCFVLRGTVTHSR